MSFIKHASIPVKHVASATWDGTGLKFAKTAGAMSFYSTSDNNIDISRMLKLVANEYQISDNPSDYIYEAVRAVTADVPNQNGDAFPKNELMRFDHRLGKRVFETFILKPHHINHRADNPKTARGVVLDAFYNDGASPAEVCPACNNRTASAEGRDETGICCKKCGEVVKDEYVELLIAVDTKKDPTFADGVRTGALDSLSMGCEAGYTDCSVCDNRARTVSQFCTHIKSGNKKKMFKAASGKELMSFEKCGEVVFTEISRVDQPADPTALQREVLDFGGLSIQAESEMLVMAARVAKLERALARQAQEIPAVQAEADFSPQMPFKTVAESIRWAQTSSMKLKGEIARLTAELDHKSKQAAEEGRPMYAWESAAYNSQIKANKQYIGRLEDYMAKARELEASGKPFGKDLTRSMSRFFASKGAQLDPETESDNVKEIHETLEELEEIHPEMAQELRQDIPGQMQQQPMTIGDFAQQQQNEQDSAVTTDELGMQVDEQQTPMQPGIKANKLAMELAADLDLVFDTLTESDTMPMNFATSYKNVQAKVTKLGNVKIVTDSGQLFAVKAASGKKPTDFAKEIMVHIAKHGIVDTVAKYNGVVSPKIGQVLQHHIEDFAGGRDEGDKKAITDGGELDKVAPGKAPKSMVDGEETDRKDAPREKRNLGNADVLEKHQPDHADALAAGVTPMTDDPWRNMREEPSKKPKSTLEDKMFDRAAKKDDKKKDKKDDKKDKLPDFMKKKKAEDESEESEPEESSSDGSESSDSEESDGPPESSSGSGNEALDEMMDKLSDFVPAELKQVLNAIEGLLAESEGAAIVSIEDKSAVGEMCAAIECTGSAPHSAAECPNKKTSQGVPPGGQGAASGVPMGAPAGTPMGAVAKLASQRLNRLYKSRLDKTKTVMESKVASAVKTAEAKFERALKLAAERQALNMEASPLKAAMFDVLASEADIDAESFYPGMDPVTASVLVESTISSGYVDFVDSLMKRASQFLALSEDAFAALEADVKNMRPVPVTVTATHTRTASRADLRKQASDGNMILAPTPSNETISDVSERDSIRSALNITKLHRTSAGLLNKKS